MDDALAAIAAYGPRALAEQGAPGMSVAITDRTHTLKILTFGYANVEAKAPVTPSTRFPIGSISKSMTALALLQLVDRGRVDLNAPVQRYLPWWKLGGGNAVTIRELLSHTGGVPDDYSLDGSYGYELALLRDTHTIFTPGTKWSYSNDGYATVGAIESAITGRPWQDDIDADVFAPIGMRHSSAYFTIENMADVATGYIFRSDAVATPPHPPLMPVQALTFLNPAGSVISTPEDMAAYMRFYLNEGATPSGSPMLKPATFANMTHAAHLRNGAIAGAKEPEIEEWPDFYKRYAFGLSVFHTSGDRLVGHTGGISGYTSCMQMNLTRGFGVIAMANLVEAPLHPCAIVRYAMSVLRAQSLGASLPAPPDAPPIAPPTINAADYAGTYRLRDGRSVDVGDDRGVPRLHDGNAVYTLDPRGDDLFWTDDPAFPVYYLAFFRNKAKAVTGFTFGAQVYTNARYHGPTSFSTPAGWNAIAGRYEAVTWGTPLDFRIVPVRGKLTVDGITPLVARHDGSYALGSSIVRFDTPAAGKMQRMWFDGTPAYRVDLP